MIRKFCHGMIDYVIGILFVFLYLIVGILLIGFMPELGVWATIINDVIFIFIAGIIYMKFLRQNDIVLCKKYTQCFSWKLCCLFLLSAIVIDMFAYWYITYFPDVTIEHRNESFSNIPIGVLLLLTVVIAPITEEFVYRLVIYNIMKRHWSWIGAMIVSSLLFAASHGTSVYMITATLFGVLMIYVYEIMKRWYVPIVCHMIYNLLGLCPLYCILPYKVGVVVILSFLSLLVVYVVIGMKLNEQKCN